MHTQRKRINQAMIVLVLVGAILRATVASHGCDVRGSSPDGGDSSLYPADGAPVVSA